MSGRELEQTYTEKEWKEIRESWVADHADNTKMLKLIQRDYKSGSTKHKIIDDVMRREKMELDLILRIIAKLEDMDKILHPSDTTSNQPATSPREPASGSSQESKFCQLCGSRMPTPGLYCPSCGKRQL